MNTQQKDWPTCEDCGRTVRWPSERHQSFDHTWCGPCHQMRKYEAQLEDNGYYAEQEIEEDW